MNQSAKIMLIVAACLVSSGGMMLVGDVLPAMLIWGAGLLAGATLYSLLMQYARQMKSKQ